MQQTVTELFIPNEVLVNIPKGQSVRFLFKLCMVCKKWNNVLKPEYVTIQLETYIEKASFSMYLGEITNIKIFKSNFYVNLNTVHDVSKYHYKFVRVRYREILNFVHCDFGTDVRTSEFDDVDYKIIQNTMYFPIGDTVIKLTPNKSRYPDLDYCTVGTMIVPQNVNKLRIPQTMIENAIVDSNIRFLLLYPYSINSLLIYNMRGEYIDEYVNPYLPSNSSYYFFVAMNGNYSNWKNMINIIGKRCLPKALKKREKINSPL